MRGKPIYHYFPLASPRKTQFSIFFLSHLSHWPSNKNPDLRSIAIFTDHISHTLHRFITQHNTQTPSPNPFFYVHSYGAILISYGGSRGHIRCLSDFDFTFIVRLGFSTSLPISRSVFSSLALVSIAIHRFQYFRVLNLATENLI